MKNSMKFGLLLAAVLVPLFSACFDDEENDTEVQDPGVPFSVCTLNVDGLAIGNDEGPKEALTPAIGQWLVNGDFSFIGVQEDFDYDAQLTQPLADAYEYDLWGSGMMNNPQMSLEEGGENGLARFNTDGVKGFWKKSLTGARTDSVRWKDNYGYFAHSWDENVVKGFRRYEISTPEGRQLVIYNMHMDAGDEAEELAGLDEEDRKARMSQWRQLRDYVMEHLDQRPVIILGDLNTYYVRDSVKSQVIDVINQSGRATITDAWIQQEKNGQYPAMGDTRIQADSPTSGWTVNGEAPDKIFYINPKGATCKLELDSVVFHNKNYFREDGVTPLGDHFPLSAHFRIKSVK